MAKESTFELGGRRGLAMAAAVLVAAVAIVAVAVALSDGGGRPDTREAGTLYIGLDGTDAYSDSAAVDVDAAYMAVASYTLGNGWYYVAGSFSLGSNMLYINGDTHIILADNATMTAGVTVTVGNSLSVYGQSTGVDVGRLSRSGVAVTLQDNASLTNTAYITGTTGVSSGTGVSVTNGVTGTIKGSSGAGISVSSGKIVNDGLIESGGTINPALYSSGASDITNGASGTFRSASWGIRLMGGGYIDNYGSIISTGMVTATAVEAAAPLELVNRPGALIQGGGDQGVILGLGGRIENHGTITCNAGSGLYIRPGANSGISQDRAPVAATVVNGGSGVIYNFYNYKDDLAVTLMSGGGVTGTLRMGTGDSAVTFAGDPGASLAYTTVEDATTLGAGIVSVGIDVAGLPATIGVGDVLTLIDGGAAVSGYPKNSTFSGGGYSFDISVAGNRLIATVTAIPGSDTYGIALTPASHTFPGAAQGYPAQGARTMTVGNTGTAGTGALSVALSGSDASAFSASAASLGGIAAGGSATFTVAPVRGLAPGTYAATVTVGPAAGNGNPVTPATADFSFTVTAAVVPPTPQYVITATAGTGAVIAPAGAVSVSRGDDQRFDFSAEPGYRISAVIVDGRYLTQRSVGDGSYVFPNVRMNHSIEVQAADSAEDAVILTITVVEGKGRAEFSVNGGDYQAYESEALVPAHSDIAVRAHGDFGYRFVEWRAGAEAYSDPDVSFGDVTASLSLDLYFKQDLTVWWVVVIVLLALAGLLLWFFLFYRRYYVVHIQAYSAIEGKDRVHRKSPYAFSVGNGYSGAVAYRVRADGEWGLVFPGEDGSYVIPRGVATGDLYIEDRP